MKLTIETKEGGFTAHYTERGLARLDFPAAGKHRTTTAADEAGISPQISHWHELTIRALQDALAGRQPRQLPPLDLSAGTQFQRRVWSALRRIASGRTRSYSEIAEGIGQPKAARAVGSACGANPIPVLVPCHRVLAADHRLGGFSGGLQWKRKLLSREGSADIITHG
jgi:O-6-methylguanine DNA methyltransferase